MQLGHVTSLFSIIVVSLIGGLTGSYEAIIIGRFFTGLNVGISYNLPSLMVSETSAPGKLGFWQSVVGSAVASGFLIAATLGHPKVLGTMALWPLSVALAGVPAIMYLISSIWLPESPFYLIRNGMQDE
uniref:Major facilitator superfamily (MFS) profile domain-containing protein n=1 Tax=Ciona savignyi TaxID=51511 RepID=H2ZPS1_CIOSA